MLPSNSVMSSSILLSVLDQQMTSLISELRKASHSILLRFIDAIRYWHQDSGFPFKMASLNAAYLQKGCADFFFPYHFFQGD